MPTNVIKRDGSKEPFDPEKIRRSIDAACQDAALEESRKNQVVEQVLAVVLSSLENLEEVATVDIKQKVLAELDKVEPSAAQAWRKYDQEQKGVA